VRATFSGFFVSLSALILLDLSDLPTVGFVAWTLEFPRSGIFQTGYEDRETPSLSVSELLQRVRFSVENSQVSTLQVSRERFGVQLRNQESSLRDSEHYQVAGFHSKSDGATADT